MENTASRAKVIAVANQKGGVGKTTTTSSLGIGLARQGMKVLLIDADAQGNLTSCMGVDEPDGLEHTLAGIMNIFIAGDSVEPDYALMEHEENVAFVPGNIELSILQYPDIEIEYVGGPIYVPPSAAEIFEGHQIDVEA